jgi:alpha-acetolactate decarboxylase
VATLAELEAQLDASLSNKNAFYAIRIQGNFAEMTTRAIDPQRNLTNLWLKSLRLNPFLNLAAPQGN